LTYSDQLLVVEPTGIETVPDASRHGRARGLFGVWFSANAEIATWMVGVFVVAFFNADLRSAAAGIVVGNIAGYAILAVLATFGPRYGVPQMLASRLAFGKLGNAAPSALSFIGAAGWFGINTIFGAYALETLAHIGYPFALCVMLVLQVVLAVYGYNLIAWFERVCTIALAAGFALLGAVTLPHAHWALHGSTVSGFSYGAALAFAYATGWVPCASDYSRYLPRSTDARAVWIFSFLGCALPCIVLEIMGAAAVTATHVDMRVSVPTDAIAQLLGHGLVSALVLCTVVLGTLTSNCMNVYSGALAVLVAFDLRLPRARVAVAVGAIGALLAFAGAQARDTAAFYTNFLLLLSYWTAPWAGVVLADAWLHRRAARDPQLAPRLLRGTFAWLAGICVSVPFWNQEWYAGPFARAHPQLGDLSYEVGFLIAGMLTLLLESGVHAGSRSRT
jgi:NCS1 family nucleobase:cation symporter-1